MNQYQSFYRELESIAAKRFPSLQEIPAPTWDHLISPHTIELPKAIFLRAKAAIEVFYRLSRRESYQKLLGAPENFPFPIKNDSVLMAYDFHTSLTGDARLVEINTNASAFMITALLDAAHDSADPLTSTAVQDLRKSFAEEGAPEKATAVIAEIGRAHV